MKKFSLTESVFEQQIQRLIRLRYLADKKRRYYAGHNGIVKSIEAKINDYTQQIEKLQELV